MDFEKLLQEMRDNLLLLVREQYADFKQASEDAVLQFLEDSKEKLEKWTILLAEGLLTPDEYKWLLKSQKDLFLMQTLYNAGISKIRLGIFKNKVINMITDVAIKVLL